MNELTSGMQFEIPGIDGGKMNFRPQNIAQEERSKLDKIINTPSNISGRSLLGKTLLGVVVGAMMSIILLVVMSAFGVAVKTDTVSTGVAMTAEAHPLAWLILLFLGFMITFFGSQILVLLYGVFFSQKYIHQGKVSGLLLLTNGILFAIMMGLFVILKDTAGADVVLFALYVAIAVFISFCQIEFAVNPNYAASSLAGCTVGLAVALVVLGIIWKGTFGSVDVSARYMLAYQSTLVVFPIMIFGQGLWEIIYHKIYETGANPFYLPSQAELDTQTILENQKQAAEKETINVDF
ncbi:MAG: hypothetical protein HXJ92_01575 [candidate division SR1 bacterium]|nr:hypothetical protein [candidate division SR1 bacterium]